MSKIIYYITSIGRYLPTRLKRILRSLLPEMFYRSLTNRQVVLISFPKCGRSWLRLMICDMINHQFKDASVCADTNLLWKTHTLIPYFTIDHEDSSFKRPEELEKNKKQYANAKVIFLVRDPRDILVSWYFQVIKRGSINNFDENINTSKAGDFIYNKAGGLKTILEFFNIWINNKNVPKDFMLLKYEDLSENPDLCLKRVVDFCGMQYIINGEAIKYAVENNTFEKLKDREQKQEIDHEAFKTTNTQDSESFKVRKGKIGGYYDYLNQKEIKDMNKIISSSLNKEFGY